MRYSEILDEAPLNPTNLAKRENWSVFVDKIRNKEPFELVPEPNAPEGAEPETVLIGYEDEEQHEAFVKKISRGDMQQVLNRLRDQKKSIVLPVIGGEPIRITQLQKTAEFGRRGGKTESERQESGLVDAINNAVAQNGQKPITIKTKKATIKNVISANKVEGTNELGKEPYADIAIHTKSGKTHLISAKGDKAPSIAGGGIAGLFDIDPNIVGNAIKRAYNFYKKEFGKHEGKKFPPSKAIEVYVRVPEKYMKDILQGTEEMGGPIDHMYVGPMDVEHSLKGSVLTVNGALVPIDEFMDHINNLYLRIRRRRVTQVLDFSSVDKYGFPNIFYARGEGGRRVVLVSENNLPASLKKKGEGLYIGIGK
jgi:hypothetical protein